MNDVEFSRFDRFIPMECNTCNLQFDSFEDYNDHYLFKHQRSAVWNCCNLVLETPYDALDHLKYHESIDHFKWASFYSFDLPIQFQLYLINLFIYVRCAACYKCFLTTNKLKYHIRRTHLPVEGTFLCKICDKECKNLRLLLSHQRSHIRINCMHCNKHITASNYEHHVRTIHASIPTAKRKSNTKTDAIASKKKANENLALPSSSKKPNLTKNPSMPTCTQVRVSWSERQSFCKHIFIILFFLFEFRYSL